MNLHFLEYINKVTLKQKKKRLKFLKRAGVRRMAKKVANVILSPFVKIGKGIAQWFNSFYYERYQKRQKYLDITKKVSCVIVLILLGLFIYYDKEKKYLLYIGFYIVGIMIIICALKKYHGLIGYKTILERDYQLTRSFVIKKMPHNVKLHGIKLGAGKDRTMVAIAIILSQEIKIIMKLELNEITDKLYLFNIRKIHYILSVNDNFRPFISPSDTYRKSVFKDMFLKCKGFLKDFYLDLDIFDLFSDYELYLKNPNGHKSKFIFNDGVNPIHQLSLLYFYICKYVRIKYVPNYILSNQPIRENDKEMAKMYGWNMQKLKKGSNKKKDNTEYEERVYYPWIEGVVACETEVGILYFNNDKEVAKAIKDDGIREDKVSYRHNKTEKYWSLSVDQKVSRVNKSLRELDQVNMNILSSEVIPIGKKRNFFLRTKLKLKKIFCSGNISKVDKKNNKLDYLREERLSQLEELKEIEKYLGIEPDKTENKINFIKGSKYRNYNLRGEFFLQNKNDIKAKIKTNENEGYIKVSLIFSDQELASGHDLEKTPLKRILDNNEPFYKTTYRLELVFKINEAHGRYNTHFLENTGEERAKESDIDMIDLPNWTTDMKMSREQAKILDYDVLNRMFGITDEEQFDLRYKAIVPIVPEEPIKEAKGVDKKPKVEKKLSKGKKDIISKLVLALEELVNKKSQ